MRQETLWTNAKRHERQSTASLAREQSRDATVSLAKRKEGYPQCRARETMQHIFMLLIVGRSWKMCQNLGLVLMPARFYGLPRKSAAHLSESAS